MINWYAVQAKSHGEGRVLHYLTEKIVPVFLPRIEVIHRSRSRQIARLEPLFPGYLFVQLKPIDRDPGCWNAVRWTPGVKSILGPEGVPVPVPDSVIETIKARVQELGFVRPGPRFVVNSRVAFQRGPLAGLEAAFEGPLTSPGRVMVLLHLLGQQRRVQVDTADLELA